MTPMIRAIVVATVLLCGSLPASAQDARYLAANCANCHGTDGKSAGGGGMPGLAGLSAAYLGEQMRAFRDGRRQATVMHQIAKGYSDEQVTLLAEYFARQPK